MKMASFSSSRLDSQFIQLQPILLWQFAGLDLDVGEGDLDHKHIIGQ